MSNPIEEGATSNTSPAGGSNNRPGFPFGRELWAYCALCLAVVYASVMAAKWVGWVVGFLIGASESPIAQSMAPAIFGLLAILGGWAASASVRDGRKKAGDATEHDTSARPSWRSAWRALFVAILVWFFCKWADEGIDHGTAARTLPYPRIPDILGEDLWRSIDDDAVADICAFTVKARDADVDVDDYETFIYEGIGGILRGDGAKEQKTARTRRMIATMEAAFPKPEPKADEKPQAEPKGEPEPKEPAGDPGNAD